MQPEIGGDGDGGDGEVRTRRTREGAHCASPLCAGRRLCAPRWRGGQGRPGCKQRPRRHPDVAADNGIRLDVARRANHLTAARIFEPKTPAGRRPSPGDDAADHGRGEVEPGEEEHTRPEPVANPSDKPGPETINARGRDIQRERKPVGAFGRHPLFGHAGSLIALAGHIPPWSSREGGEIGVVALFLVEHRPHRLDQRRVALDLWVTHQRDQQTVNRIAREHHDVFVDAQREQLVVPQPAFEMQALLERRVVELGDALGHPGRALIDHRLHVGGHAAVRGGGERVD